MSRLDLGKSDFEREMDAEARRDCAVVCAAVGLFVLALVLFCLLEVV